MSQCRCTCVCGGWQVGNIVHVIYKKVWIIEPEEDEDGRMVGGLTNSTPKHLVGKTGKIVEIHDDRYDSSQLDGTEGIGLVVVEADGNQFNIESELVRSDDTSSVDLAIASNQVGNRDSRLLLKQCREKIAEKFPSSTCGLFFTNNKENKAWVYNAGDKAFNPIHEQLVLQLAEEVFTGIKGMRWNFCSG